MRGLLLAILAVVAAACVAPPATSPTATATRTVEITSTTTAEIQSVMAARSRALGAKDLTSFQATYDRTRPAFRRCQQEIFDAAAREGTSAGTPTVAKVEPYGTTYVRAYVVDGSNGVERRYFRRDGDNWILTEPTIDELGGERSKVVEGIRVDYWGIDEDVVELVGREAAATREFLAPHANGPVRDPYSVKLIPTREAASIVACQFIAFADTRDERAPFIGMWRLWLAPSLDRVSGFQQSVLRHEGLHYLQDQFSHSINVRLDWWLIEGWPDYVSGSRNRAAIEAAVCASTPPTLKRLVDGVPTEPDTPPALTGQYYALANSMIEYMYATYGAQSYWDLVALYKGNPDYRLNYPTIFKVEPDVFYQRWLAFARAKYC